MSKSNKKLKKLTKAIREMGETDYIPIFSEGLGEGDSFEWGDYGEECLSLENYSDSFENSRDIAERQTGSTQYQIYKTVLEDGCIRYRRENGGSFCRRIDNGQYFENMSNIEMEDYISELLPQSTRGNLSINCRRNVLAALEREPTIRLPESNGTVPLLNISNGVLNPRTLELYPHDFKFGFDYCLDVEYLEGASWRDSPTFEKFVQTSLEDEGERLKLLLQTMAFLLSPIEAKKGIFYIGESNSGKSVGLKLVQMIQGEKNVSHVAFDKLGNSFYLDKLRNAKINISYELSNVKSNHVDTFKSLTGGGDSILAEKKGGEPYSFTPKVKLLFAGNVLPQVSNLEFTEAFINRLVILKFPITIPENERDLDLHKKLLEERSVIFSLAMKEFPALYNSKFSFVEPQVDAIYLKNFRQQGRNSINAFLEEQCTLSQGKKVWTSSLYEAYRKYCHQNNLDVESKTKFNGTLNMMPILARKKFRIGSSGPKHGYEGICLNYSDTFLSGKKDDIEFLEEQEMLDIEGEKEQEGGKN